MADLDGDFRRWSYHNRDSPTISGLGRSVVHGIVEIFGAGITVETAMGVGATFRIFFPALGDAIDASLNGN